MRSIAVLLALVAVAHAGFIAPPTAIFRAPAHDSAIIRSDRLGGNFAYSVQEAHAYGAVTPVVSNVRTPVAVSHSVVAPAVQYIQAPVASYAPLTFEAPKFALKEIEVPKFEVKAYPAHPVPVAAYSGYPVAYATAGLPYAYVGAPLVEVKTAEEKKAE